MFENVQTIFVHILEYSMNQSKYNINHQFADPNSPENNLKSAATIILIRDVSSVAEVFMIKRATKSNFGGAWVFPGGKVDNEDSKNNILEYFDISLCNEAINI